jgi:hypothetical protein
MLFYLFIGSALVSLFLNFLFFDLLIRRQYSEYKNSWLKDGKPCGMFFFPEESSLFFGSFRKARLMREWIVQTPGWAEYDTKAKRLLVFYRITGITNVILILSPMVLLFLS